MTDDDSLLNLARMARRVGVTQAWLKAEAEAGRVPLLRAGTRYLFSEAAVREALLDRARTGQYQG